MTHERWAFFSNEELVAIIETCDRAANEGVCAVDKRLMDEMMDEAEHRGLVVEARRFAGGDA